MKENPVRCCRCILDSSMPGVTIDPQTGLCSWCADLSPVTVMTEEVSRVLSSYRGSGDVDAIFALSGGKDSCYTLYRLKQEHPYLRILAAQFDNGFLSDIAVENARRFCEITETTFQSISLNARLLQTVFRKAAESKDAYSVPARLRASDICNTCIGIVKQKLIELALIHRAPMVIFAFSPGQTTNPVIHLSRVHLHWFRAMFHKELGMMGIHSEDLLISPPRIEALGKEELLMVHPLLAWDYDKAYVERDVVAWGWKRPELTDAISTNCLLNAFASDNHLKKYGFHPYAFDLASLVREGRLSREEALTSIHAEPSFELVRYAQERLFITRNIS